MSFDLSVKIEQPGAILWAAADQSGFPAALWLLRSSGEGGFFGAVRTTPGLPSVTPTAKNGRYASGALRNLKKALTFVCIPNIIVLLK